MFFHVFMRAACVRACSWVESRTQSATSHVCIPSISRTSITSLIYIFNPIRETNISHNQCRWMLVSETMMLLNRTKSKPSSSLDGLSSSPVRRLESPRQLGSVNLLPVERFPPDPPHSPTHLLAFSRSHLLANTSRRHVEPPAFFPFSSHIRPSLTSTPQSLHRHHRMCLHHRPWINLTFEQGKRRG